MAGLERTEHGVRLRLATEEVDVVASIAEGLAARLDGEGAQRVGEDAVVDHLAPQGSRGDPAVDAELRAMLRPELTSMRVERLRDLADRLRAGVVDRQDGYDVTLDRAAAMRLVEALNDLRIALATTIGYEALERGEIGEDDHRRDAVQLLDAMAWLQGGLIEYVEEE